MSMLSAISRCGSWHPALTWCRTMYARRHRMQVMTHISRSNSDYGSRDKIHSVPFKREINYKTDRNFDGYRKQRSKVHRKLYKERTVTEDERTAEDEDAEILRNLPESEQFGTGVGKFVEIDEKKVPKKAKKQSVLPNNWSDRFGTMAGDTERRKMEKSTLVDNERFWDDLEKENKETAHIYNHIRLARYNRRHVPNWYARRIIKLGNKGKVREAIEVFEKWMIQQDRVKPTGFEFAILIKLLAEVGYTEKAFHLFEMMKQMKIYCPYLIYSSLFNACANSPWPEDALKLADKLHTKMLVKGISPNYITYLAMIKAYGMNGDINTAFRLADEAIELNLDEDLMNNLLVACVSDKQAGFRHAVVVWRKFKKLGLQPSLTSFNLLLRAVNECGIGDPRLVKKLLTQTERRVNDYITEPQGYKEKEGSAKALGEGSDNNEENINKISKRMKKKVQRKTIEAFKDIDNLLAKYNLDKDKNQNEENIQTFDEDVADMSKAHFKITSKGDLNSIQKTDIDATANKEWWQLDIFENSVNDLEEGKSEQEEVDIGEITLPNILDPNENFSSVIHVETVKYNKDRLALIGGMRGFLKTLEDENVKPDIVTYTQLAEVVPGHQEDMLIDEMWARGIKPDISFYNILIRKRVRSDKSGAWILFEHLKHEDLLPDIKTFSCLALACRKREEGLKLLQEMMDADIMPNKFTITALLSPTYHDFEYMRDVLLKMQELDIKPDMHFIELMEMKINASKTKLVEMEKDEIKVGHEKQKSKRFRWRLQNFLHFYEQWSQHNIVEEKEHPWKHFMNQKQ